MARTIQEEKRRYTRIIFNEHNKVEAVVVLPGKQDPILQMPASVLNMSEGGIQVSIERKKYQEMQQGGAVQLASLTGIADLEPLMDIPAQVVWVMDNKYLGHILLGISFTLLSEKQRGILRFFIENRLALSMDKGGEETLN